LKHSLHENKDKVLKIDSNIKHINARIEKQDQSKLEAETQLKSLTTDFQSTTEELDNVNRNIGTIYKRYKEEADKQNKALEDWRKATMEKTNLYRQLNTNEQEGFKRKKELHVIDRNIELKRHEINTYTEVQNKYSKEHKKEKKEERKIHSKKHDNRKKNIKNT